MSGLLFVLDLGLAGTVAWLCVEVQRLKAISFLTRLSEQEADTLAEIRRQRQQAEARMRGVGE